MTLSHSNLQSKNVNQTLTFQTLTKRGFYAIIILQINEEETHI